MLRSRYRMKKSVQINASKDAGPLPPEARAAKKRRRSKERGGQSAQSQNFFEKSPSKTFQAQRQSEPLVKTASSALDNNLLNITLNNGDRTRAESPQPAEDEEDEPFDSEEFLKRMLKRKEELEHELHMEKDKA